jgi:hypothetical protein
MVDVLDMEAAGVIGVREALLQDLKFAFPNLGKFNKEAVVSDKKWIETIAVISNRLFPNIEIRHFSFEQTAEAKKWVAPMETDHPCCAE